MKKITPTKLRSELFTNIENAINGYPVLIETKKGNALLISEKLMNNIPVKNKRKVLQSKISGKIEGELSDADKLLKEYIRIPS